MRPDSVLALSQEPQRLDLAVALALGRAFQSLYRTRLESDPVISVSYAERKRSEAIPRVKIDLTSIIHIQSRVVVIILLKMRTILANGATWTKAPTPYLNLFGGYSGGEKRERSRAMQDIL